MVNLDLHTCENIALPSGNIYILHCDQQQSVGFLRLHPNCSLKPHNRPVEEWLTQVEGVTVVKLYEGEEITQEVTLKRGDMLKIPANQFHQHTNQESDSESLTSWHFEGDITRVIEELRRSRQYR